MSRRRLTEEDETEETIAPEVPARHPGAKVFAEIGKRSKHFRAAREVLHRVRAVPTNLIGVDHKIRVGGFPTDRVALVRGPSGKGKTTFAQAMGLSFLVGGHAYRFIDAEMTTPIPWIDAMFGPHADNPAFLALRPRTFEEAVDAVKADAEELAELRAKGKISKNTTCLYVVDSLGKLVPKDIQKQIDKHAADSADGSIDGMKGAAGMIRAAKNKAWLDQLVPLMYATGCAMLFVIRESHDIKADAKAKMYGKDIKPTGGDSLIYDTSLDIRIAEARMIHEIPYPAEGWKKSPIVGERHEVQICKTKVSARLDVVEETFFNVSNGVWTPAGFDRARDLLELGVELDVVKKPGGWVSYKGRRWQGVKRFLQNATPEELNAIEHDIRAQFDAVDGASSRADVLR